MWYINNSSNIILNVSIKFASLLCYRLDDLGGVIREIASFLDIPIDESNFDAMVNSLTFKSMKTAEKIIVPLGGAIFNGGQGTFINKGTNGRWKGVLSDEQLVKYDEVVVRKLSPECATWLAGGKHVFDPKA
jgi:aryl sulfotransferase